MRSDCLARTRRSNCGGPLVRMEDLNERIDCNPMYRSFNRKHSSGLATREQQRARGDLLADEMGQHTYCNVLGQKKYTILLELVFCAVDCALIAPYRVVRQCRPYETTSRMKATVINRTSGFVRGSFLEYHRRHDRMKTGGVFCFPFSFFFFFFFFNIKCNRSTQPPTTGP